MMNPKLKTGLWIAGAALALGFAIWGASKLARGAHRVSIKGDVKNNKSFYVEYLIANGFNSNAATGWMMAADQRYIEAWYDAAKKGKDSFTVDGKTYRTKGGKAL